MRSERKGLDIFDACVYSAFIRFTPKKPWEIFSETTRGFSFFEIARLETPPVQEVATEYLSQLHLPSLKCIGSALSLP